MQEATTQLSHKRKERLKLSIINKERHTITSAVRTKSATRTIMQVRVSCKNKEIHMIHCARPRRSTQTISQSTGRKCEVNDHCGVCTSARIHRFIYSQVRFCTVTPFPQHMHKYWTCLHEQGVPSLSALLHADFGDKTLCRRMKKRPCGGGGGRSSSDKELHKASITLLRTIVQVVMGRLGLAGLCRHGQNSVIRADHVVVDRRSHSVTILWSCTSEYGSVLLCYGVPCFLQVFQHNSNNTHMNMFCLQHPVLWIF